ncbi:MAG: hypothetical protein JJT96_18475 [Opitutales bacterium]|nr:hypothetical protein [Opitutales bacterium]
MSAPDYGFVTQVSDSQGHVWLSNLVYDFRGRVTQFTNGNGEVTNHTFHATRQTLESVRSRFLSTDFHHMSFEFDALGNLTKREDHFQGQYETFRYDNLNRLRRTALNASAQGGTDDLTYDALGNILTKNGGGRLDRPFAVSGNRQRG